MKATPKRILIFNPEEVVLDSLQLVFREEGMECHTADTVGGVWEILKKHPVDLIIIDSQYAQRAVINRMKRDYAAMHIIIMSSYSDIEQALKAIGYGADNFILKPLDFDELFGLIREMLGAANGPPPGSGASHPS